MLLAHHYPIPILVSLGVILGILALGIGGSVLGAGRRPDASLSPAEAERERRDAVAKLPRDGPSRPT
jgi:hypothetical protein